jgi:phytanoyl-CoA hydroxylase
VLLPAALLLQLPSCSAENTSPVSRHSWALHVVESGPGFTWAPDNWAQRPADNPWQPLYDERST